MVDGTYNGRGRHLYMLQFGTEADCTVTLNDKGAR